jgi:hypothetical protein
MAGLDPAIHGLTPRSHRHVFHQPSDYIKGVDGNTLSIRFEQAGEKRGG